MAQYKHSRLARLKLSDSDVNGRTFGGTMLAFIFALILMLVAAGIVSIGISFPTESTPVQDPETLLHLRVRTAVMSMKDGLLFRMLLLK